MKFLIDDRPAVFANKCPSLQRVEAALRILPDGRLVTTVQLSALIRMPVNTLTNIGPLVDRKLSVKRGPKKYYGNEKTIKAFKAAYQL